jgi:hypothetical protein
VGNTQLLQDSLQEFVKLLVFIANTKPANKNQKNLAVDN